MAAGPDGTEFRLFVRTQPHQDVPYPFFGPRPANAVYRSLVPARLYPPTSENASGPLPSGELSPMEAQCLALVLDLAHRLGRTVEVIDVSRVAVPPGVLDDGTGDTRLFPVLLRSDGACLSGAGDFTPGRVRRLLKMRPEGRPLPPSSG